MTKLQLLVPMDGTEFSRQIEPQIRKLFPADRWELRLLHVARVPVDPTAAAYQPAAVGPDYRLYMYGYELPGADLHPMYDEERLEDFRQALERELQFEVKLFEDQGYEVSAAVNFGEPADAIVAYAEETGADLVAMATHNRKGFEKLIHGSVARRALNRLNVPTLLLRADDDHAGGDTDERAVGASGKEARPATGKGAGKRTGADRDSDRRAEAEGRGDSERRADPGARMPAAAAGSSSVRKDDQVVTPADTAPATLAGLKGRGVLTVLRSDEDRPVRTSGSWFPDTPETDLAPLEQAERHARSVIFDGMAVEAETAGHDNDAGKHVRREVSITSVRSYHDYGGQVRKLVSFELVEAPDQTDVPDQYTHTEFEELDLETIADITGLQPPAALDAATEAAYRRKAWQSYKLDIEHRDEWGTARQNTPLPHGE
ncbi:MAG: universal stress protein [Trueperaceae bacterium]